MYVKKTKQQQRTLFVSNLEDTKTINTVWGSNIICRRFSGKFVFPVKTPTKNA